MATNYLLKNNRLKSVLYAASISVAIGVASPAWADIEVFQTAALGGGGSSSFSGMVSYDGGITQFPIGVASSSSTQNFTLPTFDTNLGTLTGVTLTLVSQTGMILDAQNNSFSGVGVFAQLNATGYDNIYSLGLVNPGDLTTGRGILDVEYLNPYTLFNSYNRIYADPLTVSASITRTDPYSILGFESSGSGSIGFAQNAGAGISAVALDPNTGSPVYADVGASALYFTNDTVIIKYDYVAAAVPEPESYAMLLAGLGLLGFIARRRKHSAA